MAFRELVLVQKCDKKIPGTRPTYQGTAIGIQLLKLFGTVQVPYLTLPHLNLSLSLYLYIVDQVSYFILVPMYYVGRYRYGDRAVP